jgi:hypothetical protein
VEVFLFPGLEEAGFPEHCCSSSLWAPLASHAENKVLRHQFDAEQPTELSPEESSPNVSCHILLSESLDLNIGFLFSRAERQIQQQRAFQK